MPSAADGVDAALARVAIRRGLTLGVRLRRRVAEHLAAHGEADVGHHALGRGARRARRAARAIDQRVTVNTTEDKLLTLCLNKDWTKTVTVFMNTIAHTINNHKQLTGNKHDDAYYIKKLNKTLSEH